MPLPHHPHSGDGASGDGAPTCGPSDRPIPPGQLVVTAIVPASEVEPGPRLPLYLDRVPAGFPSPADDYVEGRLDLRDLADANSPSCYFLRVEGESMVGAGIHHGDVVVVDRALDPANGDVVVASIDGELTLKRFMRRGPEPGPRRAPRGEPGLRPHRAPGGPGARRVGGRDRVVPAAPPVAAVTTSTPHVPRRLFALVDCSAFYVSCERVFDPSLEGVPVAVLSNNDGCVIARSQEVKDAGVKMGEPFFKARDRLEAMGARVFSSNYTLYGDMSRRVMDTLHTVAPDVLPYSIDEAFLVLPTGSGTASGPTPRRSGSGWPRSRPRRGPAC